MRSSRASARKAVHSNSRTTIRRTASSGATASVRAQAQPRVTPALAAVGVVRKVQRKMQVKNQPIVSSVAISPTPSPSSFLTALENSPLMAFSPSHKKQRKDVAANKRISLFAAAQSQGGLAGFLAAAGLAGDASNGPASLAAAGSFGLRRRRRQARHFAAASGSASSDAASFSAQSIFSQGPTAGADMSTVAPQAIGLDGFASGSDAGNAKSQRRRRRRQQQKHAQSNATIDAIIDAMESQQDNSQQQNRRKKYRQKHTNQYENEGSLGAAIGGGLSLLGGLQAASVGILSDLFALFNLSIDGDDR